MKTIDWSLRAQKEELCVRNFINGELIPCCGNEKIKKYSPRTGEVLYEFSSGSGIEVEQAVFGARSGFEDGRWRGMSIQKRKDILFTLANLIDKHKERFAVYECLDVGKQISLAISDVSGAVNNLRKFVECSDKIFTSAIADGSNLTLGLRKPAGVVAAIIGWNFPLLLAVQKMAPALAVGNSLVLKPSELTSLSAGFLAQLAIEAGVPPGVFNVVHGSGSIVGDSLARHRDVDLLSFTGSSATGKKIMVAAGQSNMKRIMLECGGKSPFIIFADCAEDLDALAANIVSTAFHNQGEYCIAGTRLLIERSLKERLLPKIVEHTKRLNPQDPLSPKTNFGALISEQHITQVLRYIDGAKQEGATLICGGNRIVVDIDGSPGAGYYLEPTIFDNVSSKDKIAQEEVFGPVLSILSFVDEKEAISIANDSCYGLAAYVATNNMGRAQRLSQSLKAGFVMIFGASTPAEGGVDLGFEGQRESGFGHEGGLSGLNSYTVSTTVYLLT